MRLPFHDAPMATATVPELLIEQLDISEGDTRKPEGVR